MGHDVVHPVVELCKRAVTVSTRAQDIREQFPSMGEGLAEEVGLKEWWVEKWWLWGTACGGW